MNFMRYGAGRFPFSVTVKPMESDEEQRSASSKRNAEQPLGASKRRTPTPTRQGRELDGSHQQQQQHPLAPPTGAPLIPDPWATAVANSSSMAASMSSASALQTGMSHEQPQLARQKPCLGSPLEAGAGYRADTPFQWKSLQRRPMLSATPTQITLPKISPLRIIRSGTASSDSLPNRHKAGKE